MKIRLWVPSVDDPNWPSVESWMNVEWPDGCQHDFYRSSHGNLTQVWNETVEGFLASDCDWLWSCHSDIEFWSGTLKRLLSWDKPLISALTFMRAGPAVPHVWEGKPEDGTPGYYPKIRETFQWFFMNHMEAITHGPYIIAPRPSDSLFRVNFTSTSCMLMHRKVLEAIKPPWFDADIPINDRPWVHTKAGGEDRYFCEQALKAGFPTYVDRSCIVGHMPKDVSVGMMDFAAWMTAMDPAGKDTPVITCNLMDGE